MSIFSKNMGNMEHIDLFGVLSANYYYSTDIHWRQEKLDKVLNALEEKMNINFSETSEYDKNILKPFYEVYYGQSALPLKSDDLAYLTNNIIESAKVSMLDEKCK